MEAESFPSLWNLLAVSRASLIIQATTHSREYQKQYLMAVKDFISQVMNWNRVLSVYHLH